MKGLKIVATGRCIPSKVVTNEDMSRIVETSDEWIRTRTGIETRHFCQGEESASSLAVEAARIALERAGISPEELGACVGCTVSADSAAPTVACAIQRDLGLPRQILGKETGLRFPHCPSPVEIIFLHNAYLLLSCFPRICPFFCTHYTPGFRQNI